jgi:hypothetical protein
MRTVIESEIVSDTIDKEQAKYPRLLEAFDALKWWLAHKPDEGQLVDDINWIYRQLGNQEQTIPSLVAVYTFDHQEVFIKFILVRIPSVG